MTQTISVTSRAILLAMLGLLAACAMEPLSKDPGFPQQPTVTPSAAEVQAGDVTLVPEVGEPTVQIATTEQLAEEIEPLETEIYPGSGALIRRPRAVAPKVEAAEGDFTLNFEDAEIHQVIKTILGDTLRQNYVVDPRVKGTITLQTSRALQRDALLPVLEMLLRMNGIAMILREDGYYISPMANALVNAQAPGVAGPGTLLPIGYQVRVIPLKYVGAQEMEKILKPMLLPDVVLRVDKARNLLMVAATSREINRILQTVAIFDVNWLKGMSVGLFPLRYVEVQDIFEELNQVFGEAAEGPLAGLFRLIPIERLNAVMVVTPQPAYLEEARVWVERLDRSGGRASRRLHVYAVQNGKAVDLAQVLNDVFSQTTVRRADARVAPGQKPKEIRSTPAGSGAPAAGAREATLSVSELGEVRIIPDEYNNTLVVLATDAEYEIIEAAIRKLDSPPRQVLVEATIAEVTLEGDLEYGVRWFFENKGLGDYTGSGSLDLGTDVSLGQVLGTGFTYALTNQAGLVRFVLDALAAETETRILSSPTLLVIDNQTAEIRVGDQVPVKTATTITEGGVTTESIQYRDTGVLLTVTPRVNAGGLVTMEIRQEVTDVGAIDDATGQRRFLQRTFESVVSVQDGQNIVLGGLIREKFEDSQGGVPGLYKVPVLGALFGSTTKAAERTELIVIMTPRVAEDQADAQAITRELRDKFKDLSQWYEESVGREPLPAETESGAAATGASQDQPPGEASSEGGF